MILEKGLTVRETEALIKRMKEPKPTSQKPEPGPDETWFVSLSDDLSRRFGTRVQIQRKGKVGKLEIEFYDNDDLDRLIQLLQNADE